VRAFQPIAVDAAELRRELLELESFLTSETTLKERDQVVPFSRSTDRYRRSSGLRTVTCNS
jgi:hypothetical protein